MKNSIQFNFKDFGFGWTVPDCSGHWWDQTLRGSFWGRSIQIAGTRKTVTSRCY